MKNLVQTAIDFLTDHPGYGYFGAAVPTGTGILILIENLTKIFAFVSVTIGIAVGVVTLLVQLKNLKKKD